MRNPLEPLLPCVVLLLCLLSASAADLKTYSDVYQKNLAEIRQSGQPKFDDLQQQYLKSLEALKARAQGKGDFKATKACVTEIDRFQKTKTLPSVPDENENQEIKAFQAAYVKQYAKLEMELTVSLGTLTAKYGQALDRLLKELTQAGKMDEAAAVEAELAKAQAAVKGFAEQLTALKGPAATNAAPDAVAQAPEEEKDKKAAVPEVGGGAGNNKPSSRKVNPKNFVVNGDFEELVDGKPVGWENTKAVTVVTEKGNTFVRFDLQANKDGSIPGAQVKQTKLEVPLKAKRVRISAQLRTAITSLGAYAVGPCVWLETYDNTGDRLDKCVAKWGGRNGSWKEIQGEGPIPAGTVTANVTLIISSAGPIDFDDIEVTFK